VLAEIVAAFARDQNPQPGDRFRTRSRDDVARVGDASAGPIRFRLLTFARRADASAEDRRCAECAKCCVLRTAGSSSTSCEYMSPCQLSS
jgi:hypothetical protein